LQRPANEGPRRQLAAQPGMFAHACAPANNLAITVNFDPQPLRSVIGRRCLFEQCQRPKRRIRP